MMTRDEKRKIEQLHLSNGIAHTKTSTGKEALIIQNDTNINKPYFQLIIEGKTIFSRGSINKVLEKLDSL
ncbi:hypothetical protein DWV84_14285 [Blautia sp. AF13-16]|uniref:hypothetical protein n=1 Tax=Blautia sp. AF13-16 TaxID=2292195 RepID=UPI000E49EDE8|nr:hypothetical protein [Blautia sp. AF13-16]RHS14922.1 hypothetical protein DWV84_14285 [Blautia sp. AF13-16]